MEKKILFVEKYTPGVRKAWEYWGWKVLEANLALNRNNTESMEACLTWAQEAEGVQYLFTFDFSPMMAEQCYYKKIIYISWAWDCPHLSLWAKSARYKTNYIFVFDYMQYQSLLDRGFTNVWHLPLAPDVDDFAGTIAKDAGKSREKYASDVVFLGNLYNNEKHGLFDRIAYLPPYVRGYLDAMMCVQKKLWGIDLLEECLSDTIWDELRKYVRWDLEDKYEDGIYEMLIRDMINKKIAQMERKEMCSYLARHFDFAFYTGSDTSFDPAILNKGYAKYQTEMPLIFHYSKINIHITVRSITSGVPLRVMDVLACEGFLLTNYQPEIAEYFEDGKELVIYRNFEDLYEKIIYYLEHEEERKQIAHAGCLKVREQFRYENQVRKIDEILMTHLDR